MDLRQLKNAIADGEIFHFTYFYNGPYSQWHLKPVIIQKVRYNCNEQYMMAQKALLFNDKESHHLIMNEKKPWKQKILGRKVRGFNQARWVAHRFQIVKTANFAKFTQHKDLQQILLKDHQYPNNIFVEATENDDVWAIGLNEDHPYASDPRKWKGLNLLGFAITEVANILVTQNTAKV